MKSFISRFFADSKAAIIKHLEDEAMTLSRLDGKPGLSMADLYLIYTHIQAVAITARGSSGLQRAQLVAEWVDKAFGDKIPNNVSNIIVKYAFDAAKLLGKLK